MIVIRTGVFRDLQSKRILPKLLRTSYTFTVIIWNMYITIER